MGKSADDFRTTDREQEALSRALEAGAALPAAWLAMSPGRALRRLRKRLGVRQDELAFRIGARQSTVSKIERGTDARLSTLRALFQALGCELAVIPVTERGLEGLWAENRLKRLERQAKARQALEKLIADTSALDGG